MTGVIYPVPAHWCWGESGWLAVRGFRDYAGSGVVHMAGGVCALVGKLIYFRAFAASNTVACIAGIIATGVCCCCCCCFTFAASSVVDIVGAVITVIVASAAVASFCSYFCCCCLNSSKLHSKFNATARAGAFILGPRLDRFRDEDSKYIGGHSIPLVTLGGFILVCIIRLFILWESPVSKPNILGDGLHGIQRRLAGLHQRGGGRGRSGEGYHVNAGIFPICTFNCPHEFFPFPSLAQIACSTSGLMVLFLNKAIGNRSWSLAKIVNGCLTGEGKCQSRGSLNGQCYCCSS